MKALILAGGSGTRLWPVSRKNNPKQFHAFVGDTTLLQDAFERLHFLSPEDIFVSTTEQYAAEIKRQLPKLRKENVILEAEARDTGPAIAYAAHVIGKRDPNAVMAVVYADHLVRRPDEFRKKLLVAEAVARKEHTINIIEVPATEPNPNLGYVKIGKKLGDIDDSALYALERFVEKPDAKTAAQYIKDKTYLWNTGMYVWEIKTILDAFKKYAPEIYECVTNAKANYADCPKISLDYAVMEKIDVGRVRIIPAELGWSDIGNWNALFDEMADHPGANYIQGEHIGLETEGSMIFSDVPNKLVVTSGLKDIIIVDTKDALLVLPRERAAEVKDLVEELKKRKKGGWV
ncbi:hypothetical protein COV82_01265 [Candidatus Peregrinibacteria bacterium CG11_big_fil_rev_8_21_14_0_20_46_8]|nr:MAG: hypothetical protein COV82_01265 [Candidatus Peregrinibacteria bacterium CG11_big_fil_rev_8_21_14_0_20_46_8]